jgi:DNA-binding MarR family transcriptional regulator
MRRLGGLVKHLTHHLNRQPGRRRGTQPDLTLSQARTVWLLEEVESCKMSELARRSVVSRPAATSNVDTLEELKFLVRFADPSDRRVVRVRLTEKGKDWCREHRRRHRRSMEILLEKLSDREREELADSFGKIYEILSRLETSPGG